MLSKTQQESGFTIIELMVVVTVVAILVAFAVPGLREAKKAGNEAATISALRGLTSSQETFRSRTGAYGDMGSLESNGYIDSALGSGSRHGYLFSASTAGHTWAANADPESTAAGDRYFYVDESNVIRTNNAGPATTTDPSI